MATYHQYSEIVAAYGYRLPPPPPPQASRVGLALLYAAVGVALGTFTGTALAVATLPPEASLMSTHFTFAKSVPSEFRIHSIANAGQTPVIQSHSSSSVASSAPAPAVLNQTAKVSSEPAPALLIHQSPVIENHATSQLASAAPAPAVSNHVSNPSSAAAPALLFHMPPVLPSRASSQIASAAPAPVILNHSANHAASPTSSVGQPQILNLAPIVNPSAALHAKPAHSSAVANSAVPVQIASVEPMHSAAQPVHNLSSNQTSIQASNQASNQVSNQVSSQASNQLSADNVLAAASLATPARPQPPAAPAADSLSGAALPTGLDGGFKALSFYSEGDATVVSYNAADGTIQTDDGRTFVIGETVSASNAVSWQDYRSNVHYRCDQNGHCSLVRTGVIALNAKLM
jgi:hypothetical protein